MVSSSTQPNNKSTSSSSSTPTATTSSGATTGQPPQPTTFPSFGTIKKEASSTTSLNRKENVKQDTFFQLVYYPLVNFNFKKAGVWYECRRFLDGDFKWNSYDSKKSKWKTRNPIRNLYEEEKSVVKRIFIHRYIDAVVQVFMCVRIPCIERVTRLTFALCMYMHSYYI